MQQAPSIADGVYVGVLSFCCRQNLVYCTALRPLLRVGKDEGALVFVPVVDHTLAVLLGGTNHLSLRTSFGAGIGMAVSLWTWVRVDREYRIRGSRRRSRHLRRVHEECRRGGSRVGVSPVQVVDMQRVQLGALTAAACAQSRRRRNGPVTPQNHGTVRRAAARGGGGKATKAASALVETQAKKIRQARLKAGECLACCDRSYWLGRRRRTHERRELKRKRQRQRQRRRQRRQQQRQRLRPQGPKRRQRWRRSRGRAAAGTINRRDG